MTKLNIFQKLLIFLIDATSALFIFQAVALIVSPICFLPLLPGYWAVWVIYYIVSYSCFRNTLGQSFYQAAIVIEKNKIPSIIRILLRESITSLPAIIFWTTCWVPIAIKLSSIIFLVCVVLSIFRNKLFGIKIRRYDKRPIYKPCWIYLTIILLGIFSQIINISFTADKEVLAKAPFNAGPRPSVKLTKEYVDFLKDNRQNINDYIMGLFNEYDHVIICERMHPEMTQYDMIYNLVTDKRFVDSVGVVFTEVGDVESRESYQELVNTTFENDSLLEKELASFLIRDNQTVWLLWAPTNWFNFLKKMYNFNHDREKKVEILFSDRNWIDRSQINVRDSIMADNIISTIESDTIRKSLTIMNYRHAFLTRGNVGYYMSQKFPGKVANVMINTPIATRLMAPIQNGYWDVATEQIQPIEYAFDFDGSPFGEDFFDFYPLSSKPGVKYKDMFTGIIFYKSNNEQYLSDGFKYISEPNNLKKIEERSKLLPKEVRVPYIYPKGFLVRDSFEVYGISTRLANIALIGLTVLSLLLDAIMGLYIHHLRKQERFQL